jgi:hypothetical protein
MHEENVNYHSSTEFVRDQWNGKFRVEVARYKRASSTDGGRDMALWVRCLGVLPGRSGRNYTTHTLWAVNDRLEVHRGNTSNVR